MRAVECSTLWFLHFTLGKKKDCEQHTAQWFFFFFFFFHSLPHPTAKGMEDSPRGGVYKPPPRPVVISTHLWKMGGGGWMEKEAARDAKEQLSAMGE
jgi:hypothetical protein